jgi:uncharacterized protein (TIGR00369 family)
MSKSAERNVEFAREFQSRIPFVGHLGIEVESIGDGTARLSVQIKPEQTNSFGSAHGGLIMSLMDVGLCTAARSQHPDSIGVITIDLSLSFIGAGKGKMIVDARVLKPGRNTVFTEGEVKNEDGSLVAKAIGTVRVRVADKK